MSDRISDRMLERARLGEFSEEELAELIDRLEREEGTTERLDRLIEADAEFLENHPSGEMVPLIREKLRRRARERVSTTTSSERTMLSIGKLLQPGPTRALALAALVGLVVVAAFVVASGDDDPADKSTPTLASQEAPKRVHALTGERRALIVGEELSLPNLGTTDFHLDDPEDVLSVEPADDGSGIVVTARAAGAAKITLTENDRTRTIDVVVEHDGSEQRDDLVPLAERLDRGMTDAGEIVLEPGEELIFSAEGITRVTIDLTRVANVPSFDDETKMMTIRAGEPGLTSVRVFYEKPHKPDVVYFRVAKPFGPDETFDDGSTMRAADSKVEACFEAAWARGERGPAEAHVRVLASKAGSVASAHAEMATTSDETTKCLVHAVYDYEFPRVDHGTRTTLVTLEFLDSAPPSPSRAGREGTIGTKVPSTSMSETSSPIGSLGVAGELSRADVKNTIRSAKSRVETCGRTQNAQGLSGTIKIKFYIRPNGEVRSASILGSKFPGTDVGRCVVDVVRGLKFPENGKTTRRRDVPVTYPFTIR